MVPNEATETQEKVVQKVEAGDVVSFICMDGPMPASGSFLAVEVASDGRVYISDPFSFRLGADDVHQDEDGNLIAKVGPITKTLMITGIDKGAGAEIVAQYEKYKPLREKRLETDVSSEEFDRIAENSDEEMLSMIAMTLNDGTITSRTVKVGLIFDIIGIQATKEQIVQATALTRTYGSSMPGGDLPGGFKEALMAAMMSGRFGGL